MQYNIPVREISQLIQLKNRIANSRHFFCTEHSENTKHDECKERVFTEEEWNELLDVKHGKRMNLYWDQPPLTKEEVKVAEAYSIHIYHDLLYNYGYVCAYYERQDRLLEILKRCQMIYEQQNVLDGYLQYTDYRYNEKWDAEKCTSFIEYIQAYLLPRFYFYSDTHRVLDTCLILYRKNLKIQEELDIIREENRALKAELLKKYTPIAGDVCDKIAEYT